jgi:pimeloyl-ACP methyl ester carboxylesterase
MLQGYRSRSISTSVGEVHVLEAEGRGPLPTLVLLHGFSSAGVHYFPLLHLLRRRVRRIVLPDLPAHGFSASPRGGVRGETILDGLTEALDRVIAPGEPAIVFGNSLGGVAAIRYALARPERVRGLILCSPTGAAMDADEIAEFSRLFRIDSHGKALDFVDRVMSKSGPMRQLLAWGLRRKFQAPEMQALIASIKPEDMLDPAELRTLRPPTLLLWGRDERLLPTSQLEFFRENLPPHARIEEPFGVGHTPYLEDPARLARDILRFAETVVRTRTPEPEPPRGVEREIA